MKSRATAFQTSAWQDLGDDDLDRVCGGAGYLHDLAVEGLKGVMEGHNPVTDTLSSFAGGVAKGWGGDTQTIQDIPGNFVNGVMDTAHGDAAAIMTFGAAAGPAIAQGLEYGAAYVGEAAPALAPFAAPLVEGIGAIGLEATGLEVGAVAGGAFAIHALEGGVEAAHPVEALGEAFGYGAHAAYEGAQAVYNEGATLAHEASDWWNGTSSTPGEAGGAGELSSGVPGITLDNGGMDGFHGPDMNGDMGGIADHATDGMSGNADFNAGYHGSEDTFGTGGGDGFGHNGAGDSSEYMSGYHGSDDMSGGGDGGYHGSEDTSGMGGGDGFGNNGAGDSSSYAMDAGSHDMGGGGMDSGGGGHDYSGSADTSGSGGGDGFGNNGAGDSSSYMMDGGGGGGGDVGMV